MRIESSEPTFQPRCACRIPNGPPSRKSASDSAAPRFNRSPASLNPIPSLPGTAASLLGNSTDLNSVPHQAGPNRARTGSAHRTLRQRELRLGTRMHRRSEYSRNGRDEPTRPHCARVAGIQVTQVGRQPSVQALNSIPTKSVQIGLHWVKWMVLSGSLNCLVRDVDGGDQDALSLQPFRRQGAGSS